MTTFQPLRRHVFVRPIPQPTTSPGGLLLAPAVPFPDVQGVVVAVGPEVQEDLLYEHVIFPDFVGQEIKTPQGRLLLLDESDLMAIVVREAPAAGCCPQCHQPLPEEAVCR